MAKEKSAHMEWAWVGRYLAVIAVSLILAGALGQMSLFQKTTLGSKLNAAHIVEFLGYGAALVLSWILAQRATIMLQTKGEKSASFVHLILPIASLAVIALANLVLMLLIKPFLGSTMIKVVDWLFIIVIVACAAWLVMAVLDKSAPLTDLLTGNTKHGE